MSLEEDVRRIAERASLKKKSEAERQLEEERKKTESKQRRESFLRDSIASPLTEVVELFRKRGLQGQVTQSGLSVTAEVEGAKLTIYVDFDDGNPARYRIARNRPASGGLEGGLRGKSLGEVAEVVQREFVNYLNQVLG